MRRLHIIGRKNSGKTTLIVDLVRWFASQGRRVGTIKHTSHRHELDAPGKDSWKHREAGAIAVAIVSPKMHVLYKPQPVEKKPDVYAELDAWFNDCEFVLVEGDSQTLGPKVEVWRNATGQPPYAAEIAGISAIITDDALETPLPIWPRGDVSKLAEAIELAVR